MSGLVRAAAVALLLCPAVSLAGEVEVGQKGKVFSTKEIKVKKGDTIVFSNDDTVAHNVFSRSEALKFNLKLQQPGEKKPVVFDQPGQVSVRCAIHPSMELEVTVEE
jgi:plastocyanin